MKSAQRNFAAITAVVATTALAGNILSMAIERNVSVAAKRLVRSIRRTGTAGHK